MIRKARTPWMLAALCSLALVGTSACYSGQDSLPTDPAGAKELDSGDLGPGARFEHRFATAGTHPYHCNHHPMAGSVQVTGDAADTLVNVSIVSSSLPFPPASVKPGGRVIWINNTQDLHTVTSD